MRTRERILFTEEEYLERERCSETKHDLINGEIIAMAGGSYRHNAIAQNVSGALTGLLRSRPCQVLGSDQRIHVESTGLYTYPDVTVVCGRPRFHQKDPMALTNPLLIVEVLSDTTEAYDRGAKFSHYRAIPSLMEVLLVAQTERRVDHFRRMETGQWVLTAYVDGAVELPALGCALPIEDIYAKLELMDEADQA